jgi:HlyD family secretion protein
MSATKPKKKSNLVGIVVAVTAVLLVGGGVTAYALSGGEDVARQFETAQAVRMDLDVTITKDGELQAVQSNDITSRVQGSTTLVELVPEGTRVSAGDVIGKLDSSAIEREIQETELELQAAEADVINAEEQLAIAKSQAEADIEAAEVELTLAELDLKQYEQGVYPQTSSDMATKVEMARIDLKNVEEELLQTQTLFARSFVTAAEVKKKELAVIRAQNALQKAQTDYEVLSEFTHPKDLTSKRNTLAQKQKKLARVQRQTRATIAQREADVRQRNLRLLNRKERMDEMQEQLSFCTLTAPINGLVVYGSASNGRESEQIAEGVQVRERQTIVRLPDTSRMMTIVNINESRVGQIKSGQRATIQPSSGAAAIGATVTDISVVADSNRSWFNRDVREYPVELQLDQTPPNLKPGMKAQATIFVDRRSDVLAVPLTAVYSVGSDRYVFTPGSEGRATPVKVTLGALNATHAEVVEGLGEGDTVVLLGSGQGRELLEAAGISAEPPRRERPGRRVGEEAADESTDNRPATSGRPAGASGGRPEGASGRPAGATGGRPAAASSDAE